MLLSALGAVPRYLEELDLTRAAEVNLSKLAFEENGFLYDEFEKMFYDLFSRENKFYRNILKTIGQSRQLLTARELADKMGLTYSGRYTKAIEVLEEVGFIKRQNTWDISTRKVGKKYVLRITDNYTVFYFRAISKIKNQGLPQSSSPKHLSSLLGLQFENLAYNNIAFILDRLHIKVRDVTFAGPYVQTATARRQGCQVDLLIHVRNRVYVCVCKLHSGEVAHSVINDVNDKIARLPKVRGISFHPVLIHANTVAESILEEDYFDEIIDLGEGIFS
ncbi:MAG: hypothetical protein ACR2PX_04525 [Endozoicomonas sp.]|uniref:hypothetical protein n=1 Tax=Endozoicomonas sp. TaxID=1892382 RepID=UPI003D9B168A